MIGYREADDTEPAVNISPQHWCYNIYSRGGDFTISRSVFTPEESRDYCLRRGGPGGTYGQLLILSRFPSLPVFHHPSLGPGAAESWTPAAAPWQLPAETVMW